MLAEGKYNEMHKHRVCGANFSLTSERGDGGASAHPYSGAEDKRAERSAAAARRGITEHLVSEKLEPSQTAAARAELCLG